MVTEVSPDQHGRQADAAFRKVAWRLMPLLMACYMLALIDRTNVGFAKLEFMRDLDFDEAAYGFGAGIFYLGYLLLEVPSNLMMDRIGLRRTLLRIMVLWGACTVGLAFMYSPLSFATLRFLLGAAEAGFFPGLILYLTYWIPSGRRAWFTALLMSCPAVAGMIGGVLAGSIMHAMEGVFGMRGWQWLFIVEGVPTILLGAAAMLCLADRPADARWLSAHEKAIILAEVEAEKRARRHVSHGSVLAAVRDVRFAMLLVACFALYASTSTSVFWAASILRDAGASGVQHIGYLMVAPYAVGLVAQLTAARSSDRMQERHWHAAACILVAGSGWLLLPSVADSVPLSLAALIVCIGGTTAAFAPFFSLPPSYLTGAAAPAGIAIVTTVGSLAGFVMPLLIGRFTQGAGDMVIGQYAVGALLVLAAILVPLSRPRAG
jgi:MFS family permease